MHARAIAEFLLGHLHEGFLLRDGAGNVVYANSRAWQILESEPAGIIPDGVVGLRNASGTYELEIGRLRGNPRIVSVVTGELRGDGDSVFFMDLISEIKADGALRDRLVAEVQKMSKLAQTDSLTGLANRTEFDADLERLSTSEPSEPFGLAIVDLDDFKDINDACGHSAGDSALVEFAARLRHAVRDTDLVARIGGDEFAVLLVGAPKDIAAQLIDRLIEKLSFTLEIGGEFIPIRASVGWAHTDDGIGTILEAADRRMYLEKRRRKER